MDKLDKLYADNVIRKAKLDLAVKPLRKKIELAKRPNYTSSKQRQFTKTSSILY